MVQDFQGLDLKKIERKGPWLEPELTRKQINVQGLELKKPEVQFNSTKELELQLETVHSSTDHSGVL